MVYPAGGGRWREFGPGRNICALANVEFSRIESNPSVQNGYGFVHFGGGKMRSRLALAAVVSVLFTLPAWAHHSHGNYVDSFTDISGTVKEVHLLLPHSWLYLE